MNRLKFAASFFLVVLAVAACGRRTGEIKPPEILYGQDICNACGMIISEARFAAASVLSDGTALKFDDVAEMVRYHRDHPELAVRAWFVHDYETEAWIRAETATFVHSSSLKTPMGGGVVAFESEDDAQAFADQMDGTLYTLETMLDEALQPRHLP